MWRASTKDVHTTSKGRVHFRNNFGSTFEAKADGEKLIIRTSIKGGPVHSLRLSKHEVAHLKELLA
ncbi:hypothetical protein [Pseudomonas phage Bertil]|uniref:Uncharacterized protein n=1 Tax=Pseudomonas phage Bertil TaxID=2801385 RepID=A0A7T8EQZ5_9CAUD|nr:hypothetical protein [Pseudomonas phage Bertil]